MKKSRIETRADATTAAARAITDADTKAQSEKTARLREARLAREAGDLRAHAPGAPRAKPLKTRRK